MSKIVFDGGEWGVLVSTQDSEIRVFANHQTCDREASGLEGGDHNTMNSWWTGDVFQTCIICDDKVPDEIQALVVLLFSEEIP